MKDDFDFIALLKFKTTEEGGRIGFAKSGYRPQLSFDFEKITTSGRQIYIGKEMVFPGETIEAEITMLSPQFFEKKLSEGLEFKCIEGAKTIGTGKILKIKNEKLKAI